MGVDYLARKSAKKDRKRSIKEGKPVRVRPRTGPRRLCRGVCFKEPVLSSEDMQEGLPEAEENAKVAEQIAQFESMESRIARELVASKAPKAEPGKADPVTPSPTLAKKKRRLSTSVGLPTPGHGGQTQQQDSQQGDAAGPGPGSDRKPSPALAALPALFQRYMALKGFVEATPIQAATWPALLAGRDVRAVAEPGAGKTLAFLLPAAERLETSRPRHALATILVLEPTRELAQQTGLVWRDLARLTRSRYAVIHGGVPKQEHLAALATKPKVIIATPGRLLDLVEKEGLDIGCVEYLVLDEADRMLSMGFAPQLDALERRLSLAQAQVGLFTATMPDDVRDVAARWLKPGAATFSGAASAASISRSVSQVVQVCAEHRKPAKLAKHLAAVDTAAAAAAAAAGRGGAAAPRNRPRVLIFANRVKTVRFLHRTLTEAGRKVAMLHGDRSQAERDAALADFRAGKAQILVASDVAARGLHIQGLPYVVNYDFPPSLDVYIHRVGRTGRLAADGHAFSFLTREMAPLARSLLELLETHDATVDPNLVRLAEAYEVVASKLAEDGATAGGGAGSDPEARQAPTSNQVLQELGLKARKSKNKGTKRLRDDEESAAKTNAEQASDGAVASCADRPAFVPRKTFKGRKAGYYFGTGEQGPGYYLDVAAAAAKATAAATKARAKDAAEPQPRKTLIGGKRPGDAPDVPTALSGKKKALPGRLRKKLAKQAAAT